MQQPTSQDDGATATELRSDAKKLGESAANRIHDEVDTRKNTAVDQAKSASSAIQRAAGEMGQDSPEWLKSALQRTADKIQGFADSIEHRNSRELMRDAEDFARNNPGTFLAACAAAGFAAARLLKAGGQQDKGIPGQQPTQPDPIGTSGTAGQFQAARTTSTSARGEFA